LFINILFIFNLFIYSSPVDELDSFFNNDLVFNQTSFNKINKDYEKSEELLKEILITQYE
tara:strand:- start:1933 stop:2112 length:180 start_codon:yes stop_codon:yes gene_type:complete